MELKSEESTIDSFGEKNQQSIDKFLAKFDLREEDGSLSYSSFRSICAQLFQPNEIERDESRVREIFGLFDVDKDDALKEQEWKTFCNWLRSTLKPVNAYLIVDVQNDFIDGTLAIRNFASEQDGADVVEPINNLIKNARFDKIIYSLDWHPENHVSFFENLHLRELHPDSKVTKENAKVFDTVIFTDPYLEQILWPKHCVMDSWGAELHKNLVIAPNSEQIRKGQNPEVDAYSAFFDNTSKGATNLQDILQKSGVTHIYVAGLAYDVCVKATCLDGLRLGYALAVVDDCCRYVNHNDTGNAKKLISENGGLIINSDGVLATVNEGKRSLIMSHKLAKTMTSVPLPKTFANYSE